MDVVERAATLRQEIAHHEHRLHVLEDPTIPPARYAALRAELAQLEARPELGVAPDSASLRLPAPRRASFQKVRHARPWIEAMPVRTPAELRAYVDAVAAVEGRTPSFVGTGAVSGIDVALTYRQGQLVRAVLRGDGIDGPDVTDNARTVGSVPLVLRPPGSVTDTRISRAGRKLGPSTTSPVPPFPPEMVVRGILTLRQADLVALDRKRIDAGDPPYLRGRAALEASVRTLDPALTAHRPLRFFATHIEQPLEDVEAHWQLLGTFKSWGFAVVPLSWHCVGVDEVLDFVSALQEERPNFEYPLEGGLLTLDRLHPRPDAPHAPPSVVKLEFVNQGVLARVESVYRAVGRGGAVLPVALLSPAEGAPVPEGAPIPAYDGRRSCDLRPGVRVRVVLGAAAPYLEPADGPPVPEREPEASCPTCRQALERPPDQPTVYCPNPACRGRLRSRLLHLFGPRGLRFEHLPPRLAEAIFPPDHPVSLVDVRRLEPERVEQLAPGTGAAFAAERAQLDVLPLWRVLYLSSVPHVSERAARLIADAVMDVEGLLAFARTPEGTRLEGAPPLAVQGLRAWLADEGVAILEGLAECGVKVTGELDGFAAPFAGRRVVLAGSFERLPRERAVEEVERRGGVVEPLVGRTTDLVVVGREPGGALDDARQLEVPVVAEGAFVGLLRAVEPVRA